MTKTGIQNLFCPFIIIYICTTANFLNMLSCLIISDKSLVSAVFIGIKIRIHIAAAAPAFISHTKKIYFPRFLVSVLCTKLCHRRNAFKSHVFYPFGHFLNRTASQISIDIGFAAKLLTQFKKFMGSETVVLYHSAPVSINHLFPCFFRSYTVFPVIFIRKAAARPAQNRHFHFLQGLHHITSHAIDILNRGVFSHINPFVDTSSQMFRKMSVNFFVDFAYFLFCVNYKSCHVLFSFSTLLLR